MVNTFHANSWDPPLIIAQIVALQCGYYLSFGFLSIPAALFTGRVDLSIIFDGRWLDIGSFASWVVFVLYIANAVIMAGLLFYLVERAKKCLDFTATLHILHFMFVLLYGGFPWSALWWVSNFVALVVMAVMGERLCMRKELQEIPVRSLSSFRNTGKSKRTRSDTSSNVGGSMDETARMVREASPSVTTTREKASGSTASRHDDQA